MGDPGDLSEFQIYSSVPFQLQEVGSLTSWKALLRASRQVEPWEGPLLRLCVGTPSILPFRWGP